MPAMTARGRRRGTASSYTSRFTKPWPSSQVGLPRIVGTVRAREAVPAMEYRLGVDLGTTYTAAAIMSSGDPQIVPLGDHEAIMPSVVVVQRDLGFLAGEAAERRSVT